MLHSPFVTVAVCTRDRPGLLSDCLRSIRKDEYSPKEILIVDNGSTALSSQVHRLAETYGCRYVYEAKRGQSAARNTAFAESKGEIVAFVDDDAVVDRNWISSLVGDYSDSNVMCVNGRTVPSVELKDLFFAEFMNYDRGKTRRTFSWDDKRINLYKVLRASLRPGPLRELGPFPWCLGAGTNMSFRRNLCDLVGRFECYPTEDIDMFVRVLRAGYKLVYEPDAIVYHRFLQGFPEVAKKLYIYGRGDGAVMLKHCYDSYFAALYFGRILNVVYRFCSAFLKGDKKGGYAQSRYLLGLLCSAFWNG